VNSWKKWRALKKTQKARANKQNLRDSQKSHAMANYIYPNNCEKNNELHSFSTTIDDAHYYSMFSLSHFSITHQTTLAKYQLAIFARYCRPLLFSYD